jgi:hypothetical protein
MENPCFALLTVLFFLCAEVALICGCHLLLDCLSPLHLQISYEWDSLIP